MCDGEEHHVPMVPRLFIKVRIAGQDIRSLSLHSGFLDTIERFSIAFTANGKRQAEISRLPKTREIYLVSAYILPVGHSYGVSTKNSEIS